MKTLMWAGLHFCTFVLIVSLGMATVHNGAPDYRTVKVLRVYEGMSYAVVHCEDPHTGVRYKIEYGQQCPQVGESWVIGRATVLGPWRLKDRRESK